MASKTLTNNIHVEDVRSEREKRLYPYTMERHGTPANGGAYTICFRGAPTKLTEKMVQDREQDEENKEKLHAYMNQMNLDYAEEHGDPRETEALQARMRELHQQSMNAKV